MMWAVRFLTKSCEVVLFKFQIIFLIKFFVQETFWLTSCGWAGTGDERDISNISFMGWKELPISVNVVRLEEKANWMVATKEGWLRMPENACLQLNMRISLLINLDWSWRDPTHLFLHRLQQQYFRKKYSPTPIIIVRSVKPRYNEKSRTRVVKKSNCFSSQSADIVFFISLALQFLSLSCVVRPFSGPSYERLRCS